MVDATEITRSNFAYTYEQHSGLVCVFVGATAGIGRATLERLATMLHSSTFYILGRNKQQHHPWLEQLRAHSPNSKFVYLEAQVSLVSDIDRACDQIISAKRKVNILCISPGGMPFSGAKWDIIFLHATPGFVNTNTPRTKEHLPSREKVGFFQWALISLVKVVSGWVIRLFGMNIRESGERHAYHLTSDSFKPGSWRLDRHSDVVPDNDVLRDYQSHGWTEKVWNFTHATWDKASANAGPGH